MGTALALLAAAAVLSTDDVAAQDPAEDSPFTVTVRPAFSGGFLVVSWEEAAEFHLAHWVGQRTEGQVRTTWVRAQESNRHVFADLEPGTRNGKVWEFVYPARCAE